MEQLKIVLTQQCYECFWLRMSEHKMINNIKKLTKNDLYHYMLEKHILKRIPHFMGNFIATLRLLYRCLSSESD